MRPSNAFDRPISELIARFQAMPKDTTFRETLQECYGGETEGSPLGTAFALKLEIVEGLQQPGTVYYIPVAKTYCSPSRSSEMTIAGYVAVVSRANAEAVANSVIKTYQHDDPRIEWEMQPPPGWEYLYSFGINRTADKQWTEKPSWASK